jgi:Tol biopolymer transport system component
MNPKESLEHHVTSWLAEQAPEQIPDRLLRSIFDETRAFRQERPPFGWRPPSMSRPTYFFAAGAVAIVILFVGYRMTAPGRADIGGARPASAIPGASSTPSVRPGASGSAIPPVTGLPGRIAFASARTGNFEIFSMKPDRSELVQLTNDPAEDRLPTWSKDGTMIAFSRSDAAGTSIWTMAADGSGAHRVTEGGTPQWSPDGRRLVYQAGATVFVINADGTDQVQVITEATIGLLINGPTWSGDAQRIVFVGSTGKGKGSDVYSVALDGTGLTKLTTTREDEASPRTSPDGRLIAYQTHYQCICTMRSDGTQPTRLMAWSGKGSWIAWSPDGQWIASAGGPHGPLFLHVVSVDGNQEHLISDTADYADVSWGP